MKARDQIFELSQANQEMDAAAKEIRRRVTALERQVKKEDYTDTGDAWDVLHEVRRLAAHVSRQAAKARQALVDPTLPTPPKDLKLDAVYVHPADKNGSYDDAHPVQWCVFTRSRNYGGGLFEIYHEVYRPTHAAAVALAKRRAKRLGIPWEEY